MMKKTSIMFFLPLLTSGGAERVSINILNTLDRNHYDIHLVLGTLEGDASFLIPNDVHTHNLHSPRTLFAIKKLRNIIHTLQPDILFSSLNRAHIALYLSLLGRKKKPYTIFRVPNSPKLISQYNQTGKGFNFLLKLALQSADVLVAQTPEMKREIIQQYHIKTEKIKVILNPIDTKYIDKNAQESFSLFQNKYINVVASGRLSYQKGYDILIDAFAKVLEKNKYFKLYIIGADYDQQQQKYEKRIKKLKIQENIIFLGFQKNPYKFYKNCDLIVLSSRWEGLPNIILENLYLQKPIVATACIPFMSTLIKNGKNGFLVPVDNSDKLAHAILNYKQLDSSYQTITFNKSNIEKLFQPKVKQ